MSIGLSEEHGDLRDSVRTFTARHVTAEVLRSVIDSSEAGKAGVGDERPVFWAELAGQGLLGLHLPEADGGSGYGLLELAVVLEELGRALTPGPFLPTVLASTVLDRAGHREHLSDLADGTATAAVGFGSRLRGVLDADEVLLSGSVDVVLGGPLADVWVLPVSLADGSLRWVVCPRERLGVVGVAGHDLTRPLSRVTVVDVRLDGTCLLDVADQTVRDLAAVLLAAESSGSADWSTVTAAEHARVRVQFGRPIGQFQAVKHRVARMLVRAEQARACAWDAARAADEAAAGGDRDAASLAAAVAATHAVDAGQSCATDCIATLGGIGFTWEHDAGFHLRRAQTLRQLLGTSARWNQRVAALSVAGVRRGLTVDLPTGTDALRRQIANELAAATGLPVAEQKGYLGDRGYTAPHLPAPWGRDADPVTQIVIAQELERLGLEPHDMILGNWVVPGVVAHGSPAQQKTYLGPSLRGEIEWCQLFSEPGAGSDLASLTTRAEKVPGGWRVNGQKVWTSRASEADHGILLARTDPAASRHRGLSYFLMDMTSAGVDVRPLRELTGEARFSEVFLNDVFVPDECLVGEPGDGWTLARTTLANERVKMTSSSGLGEAEERLVTLVDTEDPYAMATLGEVLGGAQALSLLTLRQTLRSMAGLVPGPESSIAKLLTGEHIQRVWEAAMQWQGPSVLTASPEEHGTTWHLLHSRSYTIAGGTTDIQLSIIGERMLGLPRDPAPGSVR